MKTALLFAVLITGISNLCAQNVGVGTTTPNALLHVYTGPFNARGFLVNGQYQSLSVVPDLGAGPRMMFYPGKAAFRAGEVYGTEWDNANVGLSSSALGISTIASGYGSLAIGKQSIASGEISTSMGGNTTASGAYSTAMGSNTYATGNFSLATGDSTFANASYSTAMGRNSIASGWVATAMGRSTVAKGYASTVIGIYNDSILASNQQNFSSTTPLFVVGNGNSHTDRSNAMVVLKNGNVGIGENAPVDALVLNKSSSTTLQLQAAGVQKGFVQLSGDNLRLGTYSTNDLGNVIFRLNGNDRFTILPTGNATLTGTLTQNSDARLKTKISPIANAMQQLNKVNGYHYYWKDAAAEPSIQTGVLAQEMQKVFPELVKTDAQGTLSVNYTGLIPYMIEAAKTQQQEITELKQRLLMIETVLMQKKP